MNYRNIFLALFLLVGGMATSKAQDVNAKDVPMVIKKAFARQYPKATDVEWERKGNNYEVDFDLGRIDRKVTYTAGGKVVSVEKDIPNAQLPLTISRAVKAKYPKGRVDNVTWINTGGKITYKVDIEGTPDVNVWYDSSGKLIRELAD